MIQYKASVLVRGSAADCVITAYCTILGNFPDSGGFWHYRELINHDPQQRLEMLRALHVVAGERGRDIDLLFDIDTVPEDAPEGEERLEFLEASLNGRIGALRDTFDRLQTVALPAAMTALGGGLDQVFSHPIRELALLQSRVERIENQLSTLLYVSSRQLFPASIREDVEEIRLRVDELAQRPSGGGTFTGTLDGPALDELRRDLVSYAHALFAARPI